jgi:hypothetical protein
MNGYLGEGSLQIRVNAAEMAISEEAPLSDEHLKALFKLDKDDKEACKQARLFSEAATCTIAELRSMKRCKDAWLELLDWPVYFRYFMARWRRWCQKLTEGVP